MASGWDSFFAVTNETVAFAGERFLSPRRVITVSAPGEEILSLQHAFPAGCTLLVIDGYEIETTLEQKAKGWASAVFVIDDSPTRQHDCDFFLDQTLARTREHYARAIPEDCVTFLGPQFALLRGQFAEHRPRSLTRSRSECRRVLIAFGGADQEELTARTLASLSPLFASLSFDVVVHASVSASRLRRLAATMATDVEVWESPEHIAALMSAADLAIGAAGVTSWERCCLGLPALIVVLAENQRDIADALSRAGAATVVTAGDIESGALAHLITNLDISQMSDAAARVCDGNGAFRVAAAVTQRVGVPLTSL